MGRITDILLFTFELENTSDLIIGKGEGEKTDLEVVKDAYGNAYIPGSSLAGVLIRACNDLQNDIQAHDEAYRQFWGIGTEYQRHIIIEPGLCISSPEIELKDAVKIKTTTNTADSGGKFDYQRVNTGSQFRLNIEIRIRHDFERDKILQLADLVYRYITGNHLRVGAKENKGYGHIKCTKHQGILLSAGKPDDFNKLMVYRQNGVLPEDVGAFSLVEFVKDIKPITFIKKNEIKFNCQLQLTNAFLTSINQNIKNLPDRVQYKKNINGQLLPFVDGEAILGALSHECIRICNTVSDHSGTIGNIFGGVSTDVNGITTATKAKINVSGCVIQNVTDRVQTNVKINRWTGGSYDSGLRTTSAVQANKDNNWNLEFSITLKKPEVKEVKLLILAFRNFATGLANIGGQKSIGRGNFKAGAMSINHSDLDAIDLNFTKDNHAIENDKMASLNDLLKKISNGK